MDAEPELNCFPQWWCKGAPCCQLPSHVVCSAAPPLSPLCQSIRWTPNSNWRSECNGAHCHTYRLVNFDSLWTFLPSEPMCCTLNFTIFVKLAFTSCSFTKGEVGLTSGLTHKTHTHTHPHLIIVIGHRPGAPGADPDEPEEAWEGGEDEPDSTGGVGQGERPTPEERGHTALQSPPCGHGKSLWLWCDWYLVGYLHLSCSRNFLLLIKRYLSVISCNFGNISYVYAVQTLQELIITNLIPTPRVLTGLVPRLRILIPTLSAV